MLEQIHAQRHQLKIHPQQIQLLNLFFLNSLELQQRISNELDENPFLDAQEEKNTEECNTKLSKDDIQDFESADEHMYDDIPDYKSEYQNYFDSDEMIAAPIANVNTYRDDAKQQLQMLEISDGDLATATYIIDTLSPQGLMERSLEDTADDMSFHFKKVVSAGAIRSGLKIVQSLNPVGIGVSSIRECLLLQLHRMDNASPEVVFAIKLLDQHYDELILRQFEKLQQALKIDGNELKAVLGLIGKLNFYPVSEVHQHDYKQTIIPDFMVTNYGDVVQVSLCLSRAGNVFVNQVLYDQLAVHISNKDRAASQYVKSKLSGAKWFVSAVKQREDTMMRIMNTIVSLQHDYFITGDIKDLKPMVLRHIAEKLGMDISSISRITSNKYVDTPFGIIYLKKLFSEGIVSKHGDVVSNRVIQSELIDAIASEDKNSPHTDQQLVNILSLKGYNVARRTISKYRGQMQVPVAQIRAVWA